MNEPVTHNERHEIPDCGPPWACAQFGLPGHDYLECPACMDLYVNHLATSPNPLLNQEGAKGVVL